MAYLSDFFGKSASGSFTAGEAVSAGQIAVVGADGLAYYAVDPSITGSSLRPIAQAVSVYCSPQSPTATITTAAYTASNLITIAGGLLSNGNFVVAWTLAGSYNLQFAIYNPSGQQQGSTVTVATSSASGVGVPLSIAVLSGGGFAIGYANTSGYPSVATYSNTGAVVAAPAVIESTSQTNVISCAPLNNGGFAVAYSYSSTNVGFATYNSSGVQQVAPTLVSSTSTASITSYGVSVCGLSGGGFVVAYGTSNGTNGQGYFRVYTNAGVAGVQTAVGIAQNGSSVGCSVTSCSLPAGGFVVGVWGGNVSGDASVNLYNAAGTLQGASFNLAMTENYLSPYAITLAPFGTGYAAGWGGLNLSRFDNTGTQIGTTLTSGVPSFGGITATSDGGLLILGTTTFVKYTSGFVQSGATVNLSGIGTSNGGGFVTSLSNPVRPAAQTYVVAGNNNGIVSFGIFNDFVQKYTPVGVYASAAAQGASATIQYAGNSTLSTGFAQPYSINAQGNNPPGQKMSVLGTRVTLYGIQAPAIQRNIN